MGRPCPMNAAIYWRYWEPSVWRSGYARLSSRCGEDDLLKFKLTIRMGKKGDLSDLERLMVFGARQADLSISKTADLLGFSRTITLGFTENDPKKENIQWSAVIVFREKHLFHNDISPHFKLLLSNERLHLVIKKGLTIQIQFQSLLWSIFTKGAAIFGIYCMYIHSISQKWVHPSHFCNVHLHHLITRSQSFHVTTLKKWLFATM